MDSAGSIASGAGGAGSWRRRCNPSHLLHRLPHVLAGCAVTVGQLWMSSSAHGAPGGVGQQQLEQAGSRRHHG